MTEVEKQRLKYALSDFLTANLGFCLFDIGRFYLVSPTVRPQSIVEFLCDPVLILEQLLVPVIMVLLYTLLGSYNRSNTLYKSRLDETLTTLAASFAGMLGVFFTALINDSIPERATNYELMALLWLSLFLPTFIARMVIVTRNAGRIRQGKYVLDTYVVGSSPDNAAKLNKIMKSATRSGLDIKGIIDVDSCAAPVYGLAVHPATDAAAKCRELGAQAVVVLPSPKGLNRTAEIINSLYPLDKPLFVTPDLHGVLTMRPKVSSVVSEPVVDITNARISPASVNFKRLADVLVSAAALIVLSPIFAGIAIAVKFDSKGPVLYRQKRIGYHKKPFLINKFRTMRPDAEESGPMLTQADDPRVTRIGHFLRKYRLDELPQFWNVLIGEMSLVGPRPEREYYINEILKQRPSYTLIHQVRPGITSWGMVKYGYASNVDEMLERLDYDMLYIENVSMPLDLKILFYTVSTVLTGKGL